MIARKGRVGDGASSVKRSIKRLNAGGCTRLVKTAQIGRFFFRARVVLLVCLSKSAQHEIVFINRLGGHMLRIRSETGDIEATPEDEARVKALSNVALCRALNTTSSEDLFLVAEGLSRLDDGQLSYSERFGWMARQTEPRGARND